jgi:tetratricopeptide (TPR) repeat protein
MQERGRSQLSSPAFVGREPEILELKRGLIDIIRGKGRLFLISGEPGIGKTRLAEQLTEEAHKQGVRVMWGRCSEGEGAPAYWPWIQILRVAVGGADGERLAGIDTEATYIGHLVPELADSRPSPALKPAYPLPSAEPQEARFQLFDYAARLLRQFARTAPLMLVLDDLQEADQSSLLMLRFIARELKEAPVLLIGTFREAEVRASPALSRPIGEIAREGHQIVLRGFDQAELAMFVAQSLGISADASLVTALMEATAGNPLFVDGALRMLIAERRDLNGESLGAHDFKLPVAVAEMIRRRLSFLSDSANSILAIGAVAGQEFDFDCLGKVTGQSIELLVEALDEARHDGLLYSVVAGNLRYRFAHDLIRQTIYQDIPVAKRIELHRQIAEALQQIHQSDTASHASELAFHYRESVSIGNPAKAIDYSIRAGEAALAVSAYEETREHWQAAVTLMEHYEVDSSRRIDLLCRLGVLTCEAIDILAGIAYLEAALELSQRNGDRRRSASIQLELGRAKGIHHGPHLNVPAALVHYRAAEELIDESNPALRARLYSNICVAEFEFLLIDEALDASARAMALYEQIGDRSLWCATAAARTRYLMVRGRHAEAASLVEHVSQAALEDPRPGPLSDALSVLGLLYLSMRAPLLAKHFLTWSLQRPAITRLQRQRRFDFLAPVECMLGDLRTARACHSALPSFQASISLREGDWETAVVLLEEQYELMSRRGSNSAVMDTLCPLFETLYLTGNYDGAVAALARVLAAHGSQEPLYEIRTHQLATLLLLEFGKTTEALEHLQYCRRILEQGEDWLGWMGSVAWAEAACAAAENRMADAAKLFEDSMTVFRRFGLIWHQADTLHYWGRALLRAGNNANALEKLDKAIDLYRRHGAGQRWIDRVEEDRGRALDTAPRPGQSDVEVGARSETSCSFYQEDDYWVIAFGDKTVRLKDVKGFHYIAYLLRHPAVEIPATDIAGSNGYSNGELKAHAANGKDFGAIRTNLGDAGPHLDAKAKADYVHRIRELHAELDEAQEFKDPGRARLIRGEIEALTAQLKAATGLYGDRRVASHVERARSAVSKRIWHAIRQIENHNPQLASHLTQSIRTGYICVYLPKEKIDWQL